MADYTLNYSGAEIDAILALVSPHIEDTNNPHEVTKSQVGLGNVDNTSDLNKPLSTAMIAALALKAANSDLTNEAALRLAADAALGVRIDNLSLGGRFLSGWDATTGLATSNPSVSPYSYRDGDYFVVSKVGATNYKPDGSSYVIGQASTVQETGTIKVGYFYKYDGTNWNIIPLEIKDIVWGNIGGTLTDQNDLAAALNAKEDKSNKKTSLTNSNDDYPSCKAVKDVTDNKANFYPSPAQEVMDAIMDMSLGDTLNVSESFEAEQYSNLWNFLVDDSAVSMSIYSEAYGSEITSVLMKNSYGIVDNFLNTGTLIFGNKDFVIKYEAVSDEDTLVLYAVKGYESQANRENTLSNSTTKYPTSHAVKAVTDEKVAISDISSSITSQSTNEEVAGAKAVWDLVQTKQDKTTSAAKTYASGTTYTLVANEIATLDASNAQSGDAISIALPASPAVTDCFDIQITLGANVPTINFPSGAKWLGGSAPSLSANKVYEINVMNGLWVSGAF